VFASIDEKGDYGRTVRIGHEREVFRKYLRELPAGWQIALETSGCYYWIVDEIEQAGHRARLAHALTAKRRMEGRHKSNERDARGLALLLRNGTLPEVWIPPAALGDEREMLRWRMSLSRMRTRVKNRMHGLLQGYNVAIDFADLFGDGGRAELLARLGEIPPYSRESLVAQLQTVDERETASGECEQSLEVMLQPSVERDLLDSLPCVGKVLSAVMALEIGDVRRFGGPAHLASQLCGSGTGSARECGWETPRWVSARLQRVSEVGLRGSGQSDLHAAPAMVRAARSAVIRTGQAPYENAWQGNDGRRPTAGGSFLLDAEQATGLSRTAS
jgi:transposase